MKCVYAFVLLVICCVAAAGQQNDLEAEIRRLDLVAAEAIQKKDETAIARIFAPDSVTNNPRSGLTRGSSGIIEAARSSVIDYYSFKREAESVQILGKTAVVMGNEVVVVRAAGGGPGETIRRRYTNVWMKNGKDWRIVARHANIICR